MPREVTESVKVVIKSEEGHRFEISSKGSAVNGMVSAFMALSTKRQELLLRKMWKIHQSRIQGESATPSESVDEAQIERMTSNGAKAWAGMDAQTLRESGHG